jgi:hypothetical protein
VFIYILRPSDTALSLSSPEFSVIASKTRVPICFASCSGHTSSEAFEDRGEAALVAGLEAAVTFASLLVPGDMKQNFDIVNRWLRTSDAKIQGS